MKDAITQRFIDAVDYILSENIEETKTAIAEKIGIKNSRFSEILNKRMNAGIEAVVELCNQYGLSFDWVLNGKGEMLVKDISYMMEPDVLYERTEDSLLIDEDHEPEILENKNGNRFFIHPGGRLTVEVPLMTEPAYASYAEQYFDEAFVKELPKTTFTVDRIGKGNYMAFVTKNDSMWNGGEYDTRPGTEILCRELGRHAWPNFFKTNYGFVLMTREGIFHKDIKKYDAATGLLTLSSRNSEHKDFTISIDEVNKIFSVVKQGTVNKRRQERQYTADTPVLNIVSNPIVSEPQAGERFHPQRYVDVLEEIIKDKDTIIDLMQGKIELLEEKLQNIDKKQKKSDEQHN